MQNVHVDTQMQPYAHTSHSNAYTCTNTRAHGIYVHTYTHIGIHRHMGIHMRMHVHMHTHVHICIHTLPLAPLELKENVALRGQLKINS